MKHKTLKSILLSLALGLALYGAVLPDTKPEPKEPVPTTSPAPDETAPPAGVNEVNPLADLPETKSS